MTTPVRWGILSTARINRRLIPEMHASERCEILAVASRNYEHAKEYARRWNIPVAYGSYEELISDNRLDVIYISLPNDLHALWTVRALKSGKHVLCEKPMCLSMDEFDQIARACDETGKSVMEAFMYVHHPQTALFKQLVDDGEIGKLVAMYSEFAAIFNRPVDNYRMSPEKGGGALWDIGVYPVSFFRYMIPAEVTEISAKARMENGIDMSFWGRIDFGNGVTGQFFASFESAYSTRTSIMGTEGRLDITHPYNAIHDCKAWLTKNEERKEIALPEGPLYAGEIENMNDVVLGPGKQVFTLEDSRKVLETILELRRSAGMVYNSPARPPSLL